MIARSWRLPATLFSIALVLTLAAYHGTVASFIRVWSTSETFAHGFLIVPISGYLVWMRRRALAPLAPAPYPLALLIIPLLGMTWLVGHATSTVLVEQLSLIAFFPVLVCAFFGPRVARSIAFPLGFLLFAVPFGDAFQPLLMEFTADFAVGALRLSGVPVVREGLYIATPVAQWRVAEACSGLRYLVSGVALACLFAYVTYRRAWKRLVCVALSIVLLILANGVRAYALILVGHLSNMRFGGGFAHYLFGWVVYIVVMVAFFLVGSAFRDPATPEIASPTLADPGQTRLHPTPTGQWIAVAGMAVIALGFWPVCHSYLSRPGPERPTVPVSAPEPQGGWAFESDLQPAWKPAFTGFSSDTIQAYVKDGATVRCYIAFYERQREGKELIQHRNVVVSPDDRQWRNYGERGRKISLEKRPLVVRETDVGGTDEQLLVWHWYWFPDEFTSSPGWAKLLQARASLLLRRDHAAVIVLSTPASDDRDGAEHLRQFLSGMLSSIRATLHRAEKPL